MLVAAAAVAGLASPLAAVTAHSALAISTAATNLPVKALVRGRVWIMLVALQLGDGVVTTSLGGWANSILLIYQR